MPIAACGWLLVVAVLLAAPVNGQGEEDPASPTTESLVERLITLVNENYVVADRLEAIERQLRSGLAAGRYRGHDDLRSLSSLLTEELRAGSGDLHFGVRPMPRAAPEPEPAPAPAAMADDAPAAEARTGDSGLGRVAVMQGNVGYVEIRAFADPVLGGPAADDAFERLADTDALILDLRWSRGGRPEMVAYLVSYLFAGEPFVFNRFHWRNSGKTLEFTTRADLPSPRYGERPVFALVSRRTASAAEGFPYHLQQLERATLVGEPTAGAAHTYTLFPLGELQVAIPTGRPVSPVSGGNWEATGVEPDHLVPAGEALVVAYRLALEGLLDEATDPDLRQRLEAALESQPGGE